ncbi:hypothetical protein BGZ47_004663 [Haplosporangium gracile]|nr:hypothetical protein BGZ47_004663 [Haplosporangium gracile]
MTDSPLTLFCLVDGEVASNAFPVSTSTTTLVGELKDLIKTSKSSKFNDVASDKLNLWRVSIPVVSANEHKPIVLNEIDSPTELDPTDDISDVFDEKPPKNTIHIIVQRPPPVRAPIPARVSTPLSGRFSNDTRPGTRLSSMDPRKPEEPISKPQHGSLAY